MPGRLRPCRKPVPPEHPCHQGANIPSLLPLRCTPFLCWYGPHWCAASPQIRAVPLVLILPVLWMHTLPAFTCCRLQEQ